MSRVWRGFKEIGMNTVPTFSVQAARPVSEVEIGSPQGVTVSNGRHYKVLPMPDLTFTDEIREATAPIYDKVKSVIPAIEWPFHAPYIYWINKLKAQRNAVILAHNYQTPEIFHGVADIVGDSLQLARKASETDADVIIQCGVHFMAETSAILAPEKTVLIPDVEAGCSLAESITAADVRALKAQYPGIPVVTYVNTSADVKAETDICCTSSNVLKIVEGLSSDTVILIPDEFLAKNVAAQSSKKIITWKGHCEVHERFTPEELNAYRDSVPGVKIIAHPECPPEVVAVSDFTGSTAHMIAWVQDHQPKDVVLVTECSMADNVAVENPKVNFVRPCNLCPHMKRINLPNILSTLLTMAGEVTVPAEIAERARGAVDRMIALS